jgi:hypothetical protein
MSVMVSARQGVLKTDLATVGHDSSPLQRQRGIRIHHLSYLVLTFR